MKIHIIHPEKFHKETIDFYKENFIFASKEEADVLVMNSFEPIEATKTVAINTTGIEHIKAPKIISLRGEDLRDFTAVPELCLGMAVYLTRIFKKEEVRGKMLGLIGYGRIAQIFADYASGVGMQAQWYDKSGGIDLKSLLETSDIVSLHITADEENRNFMDREKFEQMKNGAIFLNSARPWLVDEEALKWALDNKLAGAWTDFEIPLQHEHLIQMPHLGGTTKESTKRSELLIARKLKKIYVKVFLIAEAGKNFIDTQEEQSVQTYLENAKRLVLAAKAAGADAIKFQTHVFEDEQNKRSKSRYDWIRRNEQATPYNEFWKPLKEYCDAMGIEFMTTPMSTLAAKKVNDLVKRWKVGSADIVDMELLQYIKNTGKPVIISVGMSTAEQIQKAVEFLGSQIEILNYCVSIYPCPVYAVNLSMIQRLKEYQKPVGWSDHTLSVEIPALAVKMGAIGIEKHLTLDRNAFGPDHKVSLLPDEFKRMVELVRLAEQETDEMPGKELWNNFRI